MKKPIEKIKKELLLKKLSIKDWCVLNEFNYVNTISLIERYSNGKYSNPRKPQSLTILKKIYDDTGVALCGYLKEA